MAHAFSPAGSSAFRAGARFGRRRRPALVDWRVVGMTAASAVMLIAMLGRPA